MLYGESSYRFLDRVSSDYFGAVRELMREWLDVFPSEGRSSIVARFQQDDDSQHLAAFWELYLSACLQGRADVRYEPTLEHTEKRPDFEVVSDDGRFYLEATVAMEASTERAAESRRIEQVYAAIDQLDSPDFMLGVRVDSAGASQPAGYSVRTFLHQWLAGLDADVESDSFEDWGLQSLATASWEQAGWAITFTALPKSPDKRGSRSVRPIGVRLSRASRVDTHLRIRRQLKSKATRYGELEQPLVVAVLTEGWASVDDSTNEALYGSFSATFSSATGDAKQFRGSDGFWSRPRKRPAAVVVGAGLRPWLVANRWPTLWLNPYEPGSVRWPFPFPTQRVDDQTYTLVAEGAAAEPAAHFGLPDSWPGKEDLVY
jgi:hypothetical protein